MGLIAAGPVDQTLPPNNPPSWSNTPSPQWTDGVGGTYDLKNLASDPEGDSLTFSLYVHPTSLVANGDFAVDAGWTKGTGWTIGSGVASHAAGTASDISQVAPVGPIVPGNYYRIQFDVINRTAGSVTPIVNGTSGSAVSADDTNIQQTILAGSSPSGVLAFSATSDFDGDIDNVSIVKVSASLPTGVSLASNGVMTATTGVVEGSTSGIIVQVSDGTNSPVPSSSFTINIIAQESTIHSYPKIGGMQIGAKNYGDDSYIADVKKLDWVAYDFYRNWSGSSHGDGTGDGETIASVTAEVLAGNPNIAMAQYATISSSYPELSGAESDQATKLFAETGPNGSDWWGRDTAGNQVTWQYNGRYHVNYTDFVTPDSSGNRWPQYKAERDKSVFHDVGSFNMIYIDNFRAIDWDDSGNIDYNQDGSYETDTDRDNRYRQAQIDHVTHLKTLHPGKPITGNIITWIPYNFSSPPEGFDQLLDGGICEGMMGWSWSPEGWSQDQDQNGYGYWARMMEYYRNAQAWTKGTHTLFMSKGYPTDYKWLRYCLCTCLLDNAYFCYVNQDAFYSNPIPWFDEFDYDLGQPTNGPFTIDDPAYQDGCYLREFDNGLAIVNPRTELPYIGSPNYFTQRGTVNVTLPSAGGGKQWQLLDAADYSNQDPTTNDGSIVTQVSLAAGDGRIVKRVNV